MEQPSIKTREELVEELSKFYDKEMVEKLVDVILAPPLPQPNLWFQILK